MKQVACNVQFDTERSGMARRSAPSLSWQMMRRSEARVSPLASCGNAAIGVEGKPDSIELGVTGHWRGQAMPTSGSSSDSELSTASGLGPCRSNGDRWRLIQNEVKPNALAPMASHAFADTKPMRIGESDK